jgi:hypothetical protein
MLNKPHLSTKQRKILIQRRRSSGIITKNLDWGRLLKILDTTLSKLMLIEYSEREKLIVETCNKYKLWKYERKWKVKC